MSKIIAIRTKYSLPDRVVACLKGDEQAMRWVFQQYAPKMLGVCRRYLYRTDLAEEALSSGFARAFSNLNTLREINRFEGWLKSIMIRECIDTLRKEQRYFFTEDAADLPEHSCPATIEGQLAAQDLLVFIDQLPSGYRTVFNLFAIEGYGHGEIAEMLGISESTSKTQFKKAKATIQARLGLMHENKTSYGSH